jgi:hypothetical protein
MENLNQNATVQNSSDAEALEALFDKYQKRDEKKKRLSKEEILAKYFNPRKDTEIFRALPRLHKDDDLIQEGWFHKVQAGKYAKNTTAVYCPAKNNPKVQAVDKKTGQLVFDQQGKPVMVGEHCPLCAKSARMRSKMDKSIQGKKKEQLVTAEEKAAFEKNKGILTDSNKYESKLYYIIRGIDRGAEKDGVKFWRFKHNFKSQGIHDKLWKPIIQDYYKQTGKVYSDVENGIDLMISVVDNEFNGNKYRDVSAIIPRMPSKLHGDALIAKQWLDDKTTWREVFKPKKAPGITETQYLELASEEREVGQKYDMRNTPYYDEEQKKWIFPNHPDFEAVANTRTQNLDASTEEDEVLIEEEGGYIGAAHSVVAGNNLDITEMSTETPKGEAFNHGSVSLGAPETKSEPASAGAYDDLPF